MKRLNWLKNFGLMATLTATTVPAIMMSASCSVTSGYADVFDFKTVLKDGTAQSVKRISTSFNNLLYGSLSNHNGNYMLFVGSNMNDAICNFFGVPGRTNRDREDWYSNENFTQTAFYLALKNASTKTQGDTGWGPEGPQDCGFYSFIDFFDLKIYDKTGHQIFIAEKENTQKDIIKPFDVWNEALINQTKKYNKEKKGYEWDKDSVKVGEYIRQDQSAIAYREMCKRGLALYPTTEARTESFDVSDNNDVTRLCIFKKGKLVSIASIPDGMTPTALDTFAQQIVDNYKVEKKDE